MWYNILLLLCNYLHKMYQIDTEINNKTYFCPNADSRTYCQRQAENTSRRWQENNDIWLTAFPERQKYHPIPLPCERSCSPTTLYAVCKGKTHSRMPKDLQLLKPGRGTFNSLGRVIQVQSCYGWCGDIRIMRNQSFSARVLYRILLIN